VLLAARCGREFKVPAVLFLRYPPALCRPDRPQARLAFRILEQAVQDGIVRVATDSHRLAIDYADHSWAPIEVFPIPQATPLAVRPGTTQVGAKRRIRVASLGNAPTEKGILEILQTIELLKTNPIDSRIEFVLQINDPDADCRTAVRRLTESCAWANVTLIPCATDAAGYRAILDSADVVLVPNRHDIYRSLTFAVLIHAVTAGKPIIVPADTWITDELARWGAGLAIAHRNPQALAEAIEKIVLDFDSFSDRAARSALVSREFHCSPSFLRHLFGQTRTRFLQDRRVLLSYPWGNLFLRDSGASVRATLLVDLLLANGYAVTAHCTREAEVAAAPEGVACLQYHGTSSSLREPRFLAATLLRLLRAPWQYEARDLWFRFEYWCRERPFRLLANRALYQCSAVFLKYPFLAEVFAPLCRGHAIELVVADYDILAQQVGNRLARRQMLRREVTGMKCANLAACVSNADRAMFAQAGCEATVIPNAIDVDAHAPLDEELAREILEHRGLVLPRPFCLFVGSAHPPNLEAARQMAALAADPAMRSAGMNFVTAGNCQIEGTESGGFIQLGLVAADALTALYALADFVVVPLSRGTGTSLKVLEAMAYGKVVIGTPVAFRGISVSDGGNAILVSDAKQIPNKIVELRQDDPRRTVIGHGGRNLAKGFDFRKIFVPYLTLLRRTSGAAQAPSCSPTGVDISQNTPASEFESKLS
jgi:glycosyltransferase involved in cell wall biosynthesis